MGRFQIGDTYYYQELIQMFDCLTLLKDLTVKKYSLYLAITETHFLIFRELPYTIKPTQGFNKTARDKGALTEEEVTLIEGEGALIGSEGTKSKLKLAVAAEVQCIDTIILMESEGEVKLLLKKYKSIKLLYHESEEVTRHFKLSQPEVFIRGVLKCITKFQPCHIEFEPGGGQRDGSKRKRSAS